MTIISRVVVDEAQIEAGVQRAVEALAPDVVRIRFNLGEDWTGDPSVFFRVVLSKKASRLKHLGKTSDRIEAKVRQEVRPEELGLNYYFNFRSESERLANKEAAWI